MQGGAISKTANLGAVIEDYFEGHVEPMEVVFSNISWVYFRDSATSARGNLREYQTL